MDGATCKAASRTQRHFEETRLQLIADGYTIVPSVTESKSRVDSSEMAFDAKRRLGIPRQFGRRDCILARQQPRLAKP
ncbi:hypothetical protein [Mesorhizobium huakuii]|uniref:Uncharacterized protein n=1 Tax=Mesorhizobium huakuii TaxID=28104 RepID=A0A7G6SZI2_9HYPH|nr:hypothetical protein [Mesorhizobium huakuii]QND59914.1 hypothetical protein HB778_27660 [Mesorhizobium huakuii]